MRSIESFAVSPESILSSSHYSPLRPYKDYRGGKGNKVPDFLDKLPKTTPVGFSIYPFEIA